jgi:anti-anti-sigma factor
VTPFDLQVHDTDDPNVVVAEAAGELDLTNANDFEDRLGDAADSRAVALDLTRVSFVDSAALHVLFRLARRFGDRFGIVLDPSSPIARTFGIVGLDTATRIRESTSELLDELTA